MLSNIIIFNNIITIKAKSMIHTQELNYEIVDINNESHIEVVKYHLFSPIIAQSNNISNTNNKTSEDYIRDLHNTSYQYHIIYIINDNNEKEYIGLFRFIEYEFDVNSMALAYTVIPKYQNKKLGSQIPILAEQYLRSNFPNVHTIYANVFYDNIASIKILQKNGFVKINNNDIDIKKLNMNVINKHNTLKELYNSYQSSNDYRPTLLFKKKL